MQILKLTNNRIYFSEEEYYRINADIIFEFSLKKGMELNEQLIEKLFVQLILYRAYSFLVKRDYAKKELKQKLLFEFKWSNFIDKATNILEEKGYIDDFSYTKNYINSKSFSKKRIYYDLSIKGIRKEMIDEVFSGLILDEKEDIRKILPKLSSKDERKKVEYLLRKGYNLRDILEVIKEG